MHTHTRKKNSFVLFYNDPTRLNVLNELNAHTTFFFKKKNFSWVLLSSFFMPLHLPLDDSVMCVCELERRLMCWDEHKINLTHVFSEEIDESPKSLSHDVLEMYLESCYFAWTMLILNSLKCVEKSRCVGKSCKNSYGNLKKF